jgi:hypothetical protein
MKTIKVITLLLVSMIASYSTAQTEYKKFSFSVGTGTGFTGLSMVNGGAYSGAKVTTQGGVPIYNFLPSSMFLTFEGSARWNWFEPFIELQNGNFHSDKTYQDRNLKADLHFLNFNFGAKIRPIKPIFNIDPYVKVEAFLPIYDGTFSENSNVNNPNAVIIDDTVVSAGGFFGLSVGGDYMFTKNLGAYLQLGYGFNVVQLGAVLKL